MTSSDRDRHSMSEQESAEPKGFTLELFRDDS
jgi:hypothetical protein